MSEVRTEEEKKQTYEAYYKMAIDGRNIYEDVMENETKNPLKYQEKLLFELLQDNKDTEYGKKYGFGEIHSIEEYQKRVPVQNWDGLRPYMERMRMGEKNVLISYPFDHMNLTAGTTGSRKTIPFTEKQAAHSSKYVLDCIYGMMGKYLGFEWCKGRCFSVREHMLQKQDNGITLGHAGAKALEAIIGKGDADVVDKAMRTKFTSPFEAAIVGRGIDATYVNSRFFIEDQHVTGIAVHFMSHLVPVLTYISKNYELLIEDIEKGTINEKIEMPLDIRESLMRKIKPNSERAKELKEIFKNGSDFQFGKKVWPDLKYFVGAGGDGFAIYDKMLKERFLGEIDTVYSGVTSTEGVFSFAFEPNNKDQLFCVSANFLEFLPVDANNDYSKIITIDKLEEGKIYEVILSNFAGEYRYRMSDAFLVTGKYNNSPKVQFVYRVNKTLNAVAEKTTEMALEKTIENTAKELGFKLNDFNVTIDREVIPPRYLFLIEYGDKVKPNVSQEKLDEMLCKNLCKANESCIFYMEKGAFGKPTGKFIQPESNLLYRELQIYNGKEPNAIKPVHILDTDEQLKFFFATIEK